MHRCTLGHYDELWCKEFFGVKTNRLKGEIPNQFNIYRVVFFSSAQKMNVPGPFEILTLFDGIYYLVLFCNLVLSHFLGRNSKKTPCRILVTEKKSHTLSYHSSHTKV